MDENLRYFGFELGFVWLSIKKKQIIIFFLDGHAEMYDLTTK